MKDRFQDRFQDQDRWGNRFSGSLEGWMGGIRCELSILSAFREDRSIRWGLKDPWILGAVPGHF